jgi:GMP synthase (glutamine-hydrolysing)
LFPSFCFIICALQLAHGFRVTGWSGELVTALENAKENIYAVQFHPEVDLSVNGKEMLRNFLFKIAKCQPTFTLPSRREEAIRSIRAHVGEKKVRISFNHVDFFVILFLWEAQL